MLKASVKRFSITMAALAAVSTSSIGQGYLDISSDIGTFQPVTLGDDISLDPCGSRLSIASSQLPQVDVGSVCDITSGDNHIGIYYLVSSGTTTHSLVYGNFFDGYNNSINGSIVNPSGGSTTTVTNNAAAILSSPATLSTGAGTLFSSAGTYVISLITGIRGGQSPTISIGGTTYNTGDDTALTLDDTGFDINGASVGNFDNITLGSFGLLNQGSGFAIDNGRRNVAFSQTTIVVNDVASVPEPSSLAVLLGGLLFGWRTHRKRLNTNL